MASADSRAISLEGQFFEVQKSSGAGRAGDSSRISSSHPAVVLIHGLGNDSSYFGSLIAADFLHGCTLLRYDVRGHGRSKVRAASAVPTRSGRNPAPTASAPSGILLHTISRLFFPHPSSPPLSLPADGRRAVPVPRVLGQRPRRHHGRLRHPLGRHPRPLDGRGHCTPIRPPLPAQARSRLLRPATAFLSRNSPLSRVASSTPHYAIGRYQPFVKTPTARNDDQKTK